MRNRLLKLIIVFLFSHSHFSLLFSLFSGINVIDIPDKFFQLFNTNNLFFKHPVKFLLAARFMDFSLFNSLFEDDPLDFFKFDIFIEIGEDSI